MPCCTAASPPTPPQLTSALLYPQDGCYAHVIPCFRSFVAHVTLCVPGLTPPPACRCPKGLSGSWWDLPRHLALVVLWMNAVAHLALASLPTQLSAVSRHWGWCEEPQSHSQPFRGPVLYQQGRWVPTGPPCHCPRMGVLGAEG